MSEMDKKEHLKNIQEIRDIFLKKEYYKTVEWLDFLYNNVENDNPSDYEQDWKDIISAYEKDLRGFGDYPINCYIQISSIFRSAIDLGAPKFRSLMLDVYPYIKDWRMTGQNLMNISNIADVLTMNPIARYYFYCFIYLIEIEGSYDNWIKILFYLIYNVRSGSIKLEQIEKDYSLRTIKDVMISYGINEVIFGGYENGCLRNSIAHGQFLYDESTDKMTFKNIHRDIEKYNKEFTFNEFIELMQKSFTVSRICSDVLMLLRISDITRIYMK